MGALEVLLLGTCCHRHCRLFGGDHHRVVIIIVVLMLMVGGSLVGRVAGLVSMLS